MLVTKTVKKDPYLTGLRNVSNFMILCMKELLTPFQLSVAFYIETSHWICSVNQMTGFYMKCNTGLKCVNDQKSSGHLFNFFVLRIIISKQFEPELPSMKIL